MHHTHIAQRVFNTPLMVDPAKALAFLTGLGPRITGREITVEGMPVDPADQATAALPARASLFSDDLTSRQARNGSQPFAVVDGIAVIEIAGTLVHRGAWIGQSSGLTSYEGIATQLQAALADPAIRAIALDIDSFGGEVAGAFDLADRIRAARAQKPVHAFVADHALSAAYALASQADRIILPRTGAVGSIGVVAMHSDMSGALDQRGIAVTLIHAGARKVDANPYQPLPETVRARIAGELEDLRQLFAETVAEGRGHRLDTLRALGTEASVFRGEAAVFAGLADEVADPVTAFRAFAAAPRGTTTLSSNPKGKGLMMTTAPEDHAQPAAAPAASPTPEPTPPAEIAPPPTAAAAMSPEAIRAEAAEVAQVCAQAARLGIQINAADAVARGVKPEALRAKVLADLAARSDAAGIIATAPAAGAKESPIVAAAKKSAAASR
ncbi:MULTISPECIES: S49 family peptidase [unclassified Paracoccus (in: a-proteobacteria)]|uniref:S49 family peptidase n=1 Tax=unclassified Paracoccus (in: a-proteobacteria) TaxID=2688777 RepID=UPI0012B329DC|nr:MULTISPECIES: S49 family peptidase [unclassified Paracoccus (in: a-proteobacteria)]UXU76282.1 S49 family peptidase [Paracoccus sp. SMMA_5]UXU82168.1 S49 family peptidase [Paracoccus sp. SMMA_5_TC]